MERLTCHPPNDKSTAARLANRSIRHRRVARAAEIGKHWPELPMTRKRAALTTLIERIEVRVDRIDIGLRPPGLAALLDGPDTSPQGAFGVYDVVREDTFWLDKA